MSSKDSAIIDFDPSAMATIGKTTPRNEKGYPINGFKDDELLWLKKESDDHASKVLVISEQVAEDYKKEFRNTRVSTLDNIKYLIFKLLIQEKAVVIANHPNSAGLKRVVDTLYSMGYIQPYYGWYNRRKGNGRPMAIKPSNRLIELIKAG